MQIAEFNSKNLKALELELTILLAQLGEKYNVNMQVGKISYNSQTANIKVEASTISEGGQVQSQAATDFEFWKNFMDLKQWNVGDKFELTGETYTIVGMKPRSKKIIIANGKSQYLIEAAVLRSKVKK